MIQIVLPFSVCNNSRILSLNDSNLTSNDSNAGQLPEPGVTVIIVIPLRIGISVNNRCITVVCIGVIGFLKVWFDDVIGHFSILTVSGGSG